MLRYKKKLFLIFFPSGFSFFDNGFPKLDDQGMFSILKENLKNGTTINFLKSWFEKKVFIKNIGESYFFAAKRKKKEKKIEKNLFLQRLPLNKKQEEQAEERKKTLTAEEKNTYLITIIQKEPCSLLKIEGEILNYNNESCVDGQISLSKVKEYYEKFFDESVFVKLKEFTENENIENFLPLFFAKYGVDEHLKITKNRGYNYCCRSTNNSIISDSELLGFCKKPISLYPTLTIEEITFLCKLENINFKTIVSCLGYPTVIRVTPGINRKFFFEFPVIVKNENGPSYIFSLSVKSQKAKVNILQAKKNFLSSPIYYEKQQRIHLNNLTELKKKIEFLKNIKESSLKIENILNELGDFCIYNTNGEMCTFSLFDQYFCEHEKQTKSIFLFFLYDLETLKYKDSFFEIDICDLCFS